MCGTLNCWCTYLSSLFVWSLFIDLFDVLVFSVSVFVGVDIDIDPVRDIAYSSGKPGGEYVDASTDDNSTSANLRHIT